MSIIKFEIGKKYSCRSFCDYDCVWDYEVISRTAKMITLKDDFGRISKRKVYEYEGRECCHPEGRYSMSPIIRA